MNLESYYVFSEVAHAGNLTAVARALNYSQPGISHIIASLEKECGFALFTRSKSGVKLTEHGKIFLEYCREVLLADERLHDTISNLNGDVVGCLQIGCYISIANSLLPDIINDMHRLYPHLQFSINNYEPNQEFETLKQGFLDIAFGMSDCPAGYDFIPLLRDPSVCVLPKGHPLAEKSSLTTEDLEQYELLIQHDRCATELRALFGHRYSELTSSCMFNYDPMMIHLVERGYGLGVTSKLLIQPHYNIEVRPFTPPVERIIGLIIPKRKPMTLATQRFVDLVCKKLQSDEFKEQEGMSNQ